MIRVSVKRVSRWHKLSSKELMPNIAQFAPSGNPTNGSFKATGLPRGGLRSLLQGTSFRCPARFARHR